MVLIRCGDDLSGKEPAESLRWRQERHQTLNRLGRMFRSFGVDSMLDRDDVRWGWFHQLLRRERAGHLGEWSYSFSRRKQYYYHSAVSGCHVCLTRPSGEITKGMVLGFYWRFPEALWPFFHPLLPTRIEDVNRLIFEYMWS